MADQQIINFAASSSSSVVARKEYDVFLCFRGEDTRLNFTSCLYDALIVENVETYIDSRLKKGDEISQALIKAIEESRVCIVIFSENFASSKWCLEEICTILDCKKDQGLYVIPVFYKINPSHVRNQTGSFKPAFAKHKRDLKGNNGEVLLKWRDALTRAANLAGWDSRNYRTESEFITKIVEDVLQKLNEIKSKVLDGIERNYAGEDQKIGKWGMDGIEDKEYKEERKGNKGKQKLQRKETNAVDPTKDSIENKEVHQGHASSSTPSKDADVYPKNATDTILDLPKVPEDYSQGPGNNCKTKYPTSGQLEITPTEEYATFRNIGQIKKMHIPLLEQAIMRYPSLWSWGEKLIRAKMRTFGYTVLGEMLEFLTLTRWGDLTEEKKTEFEYIVGDLETVGFDIQWLRNTQTLIRQSKIDKETIDHMKTLEVQVKEKHSIVEELKVRLRMEKMELANLQSQEGNMRCQHGNLYDFIGF